MFKKISKKINSIVQGIKSVFSGKSEPAPERSGKQKKEHPSDRKRGSKKKKQMRQDENGNPYVRLSDRRPSGKMKEAEQPSRKQSGKKPQKKVIPPMPEIVPPPESEGKLRFCDLELAPEILAATQDLGFKYCTEIQAKCLPYAIAGNDLAAKAQTGTGKTAAFLASTMTRLLRKPLDPATRKSGACRVLVLAPTRELAIQIQKDAENLGKYTDLNNMVVFGGMDHRGQRDALMESQVDILAGTPGRIIDYSRSGDLDLSRVEVLVIDEADRMLDMGFIPDVKRIVSQMPRKGERQTLLFSATLDESILRLASGWLADPVVLESEPEKMVSDNINQTFYSVLREEKLALVLHILKNTEYERMIIFGNRKDVNLRLQYDLARYGFNVPLLSGDISQDKRIRILERFRSGKDKVVIATDVAARGIHVDDVSIVVNYDLPEQPEDYIHRIGRTGRAGNTGTSISFLCEYGAYYLPPIEELLKTRFSSILPDEEMLKLPPEVENPQLPAKLPSSTARKTNSFNRRGSYSRRNGRR